MPGFYITLRKQIFCIEAEREMVYLERGLVGLDFPPFPGLGIELSGDTVLCQIMSVNVKENTSDIVCYCQYEELHSDQALEDRLEAMVKSGWKVVQECWGNPE